MAARRARDGVMNCGGHSNMSARSESQGLKPDFNVILCRQRFERRDCLHILIPTLDRKRQLLFQKFANLNQSLIQTP